MKTRLPTDRQILDTIFERYYAEFAPTAPSRASSNYVPIDIPAVADKLKTDANMLFGRLYYHLDHKYRYQQQGGAFVHLFTLAVGDERHCVHLPYLAAVLATLREEDRNVRIATGIAFVSLGVSIAAILVSIFMS